ncbi:hypothetical protein KAR91_78050 [Candidatus Pacearchaeota archaeon]|nr:hypothetical protein [Candidatus Pacearchaeota archaeon]
MSTKNRTWVNWASTNEISQLWKVSQRRVQQILKELNAQSLLDVGVLVIDIGSTNPVSMPIYRRIES